MVLGGPGWTRPTDYRPYVGKDGTTKRKRVQEPLAPYTLYPFKDDKQGRKQIREKLAEKISGILRSVNANVADSLYSTLSVEDFINRKYFPRLNQRLQLEGAMHIEPSTIHEYQSIFNKHAVGKPAAKIPIAKFTAKDGPRFPREFAAKTGAQHSSTHQSILIRCIHLCPAIKCTERHQSYGRDSSRGISKG